MNDELLMIESMGIRNQNPCQNCKREWKRPGCHDTCPDRKPWLQELARVREERKKYSQKPFVKHNPFDY